MKQLFLCLCLLGLVVPLRAQTDGREYGTPLQHTGPAELPSDTLAVRADSLSLSGGEASGLYLDVPYALTGAYGLGGFAPYTLGSDGFDWRLHEGLNAQFSLSLSAAFGKHAPSGVGFGQTAALAYLAPITPKLSVAAGLYASNTDWGAWSRTDVGVGAALAYQLNDCVNLYAYGSKTFMPRFSGRRMAAEPFPLFIDVPRDRIGAAAEFKVGKNAMIGVSVERTSY